jgi:hypothetical protein
MELEYWFAINDDATATVLVERHSNNSHSIHRADDAENGGPDGGAFPYHWRDGGRWTKTTKEHAETLISYELGE